MQNRNLELLTEAARLLKPLLNELVFVGESTTALLITDKAAAEVRPTYDCRCDRRDRLLRRLRRVFRETPKTWFRRRHKRRRAHMPLAAGQDHPRCHAARRKDSRLLKPLV